MQSPTSSGTLYMSPKRKRDIGDCCTADTPMPSRLRTTNLPSCPQVERMPTGGGSPRTAVAGRLQGLDLKRAPDLEIQDGTSTPATFGSCAFSPLISLPCQTFNDPITPPYSSHGILTIDTHPRKEADLPLEIPETPRLRPVSSPTPPLSTTPKAAKSPPPPSPAQELWWSDTEITGHDLKDPTDDGYGINGVGFLPTPAIANARAERRKKQLAEWKNREAKEARQKRSDRRKRRDAGAVGAISKGNDVVQADNSNHLDEGRKVRFLEI